MQSILCILCRTAGEAALAPSAELDTVWQALANLERIAPEQIAALREGILCAVGRAEEDGFAAGFRCAAALVRECF